VSIRIDSIMRPRSSSKGRNTSASVTRVVVSVSTSRSRDGLETYQRIVSVSSREKLSTSWSRLGLGKQTSRSHLELLRLVPMPACAAMMPVH